jgi:hypothetical protein
MLRLYWKPMWMTDEDARQKVGDPLSNAATLISNVRLEKILTQAYEKGKKDGAHEHERAGALALGEELRREIERWPQGEPARDPALVPVWALEGLLEKWNVPPLTPTPEPATI